MSDDYFFVSVQRKNIFFSFQDPQSLVCTFFINMGSEECETPYVSTLADTLCGTDGQSYYNKAALECRAKNVDKNLRLKHEGRCWSFENYHHEIVLALLVSIKILSDKIKILISFNCTFRHWVSAFSWWLSAACVVKSNEQFGKRTNHFRMFRQHKLDENEGRNDEYSNYFFSEQQ